MMITS